jgi:ATP-binding cassette subfamily C (CFTR/MRP) protein 1
MVRQSTEAEANMNSIERIDCYTKLESEAPPTSSHDQSSSSWPTRGEIVCKDVWMRYSPSSPYVLEGFSLTVTGGEKVGICGRTGAGKSSLLNALFRIVELERGSILIDGVDIARLGLHTLRSRVSIVPQDPVLFTGSVRYNLDPFRVRSDKRIWGALETVNMRRAVTSLDDEVQEGGSNLSVGERQLLCMGRALLEDNKILVLDEATAAIDMFNDEIIQRAIREQCRGRTILTIAHRLNTILDYDKVCVLGQGQVLEYDSPQTLAANASSHFASMLRAHQEEA